MIPVKIPAKAHYYAYRLLLITGTVFFVLLFIACCCYLLTGHDHLAVWYRNLNACFYHSSTWNADFFTPGIKSDGNMYSIIAILIAIAGFFHVVKRIKKNELTANNKLVFYIHPADLICVVICTGTCVALWRWGNSMAKPAFDEVFSAQHIAGIHPFQGVSYYMQPNNHLFFNLLNNLVFHFATNKVMTGRFISLIAYCATIISIFLVLKSLFKNRWLALLMGITLSLQFFTWGFSFQARGYEFYLLAGWGMVISLFCYLQTNQKRWLYLNVLCIATGYFCLPSFLYIHVAQILFTGLYQLFYKSKEHRFWKSQFAAIFISYLCYLPVLCFSGVEAITRNSYTAPMDRYKTAAIFWQKMSPFVTAYNSHMYSDLRLFNVDITLLLFFLPLTLFLARKNKDFFLFGLFYFCTWFAFLLIATLMKRMPFERNLIGQYSVSIAVLLLLFYWFTGLFFRKRKIKIVQVTFFPVLLILSCIHFYSTNKKLLKETLYEFNVNDAFNSQSARLKFIPPGSTVAFSDGEFYSYYILREKGCIVSKCPNGSEDFYLIHADEEHPPALKDNYVLVNNVDGYEIYQKR